MKQPIDPWFGRMFWIAASFLVLYAIALILRPFSTSLFLSAALAWALRPLQVRLLARAPARPTGVAAVLTVIAFLVLVLPLLLAAWALVHEALAAYPLAKESLGSLRRSFAGIEPAEKLPWLLEKARELLARWGDPESIFLDNLNQLGSWAAGLLQTAVKNAVSIAANLVVFAALLFFFLRDGAALLRRTAAVMPISPAQRALLSARTNEVLGAILQGVLAVALAQGAFAWIGLALFKAPFPLLLAALCTVLSPIPMFGCALVWAPLVLKLALAGDYARAVPLLAWFSLVVGLVDNLVRPVLVGARAKMPIPLVLIGMLGGLRAFGLAGMFLGPMAIVLALAAPDLLRGGDDAGR